MSWDDAPPHDERFLGYGFTRNTQVPFMHFNIAISMVLSLYVPTRIDFSNVNDPGVDNEEAWMEVLGLVTRLRCSLGI